MGRNIYKTSTYNRNLRVSNSKKGGRFFSNFVTFSQYLNFIKIIECVFIDQDMMEEQRSKMDDLEKWENMTIESSQSIDLRLQRLEDTAQQTASLLAVIHR
jgi:hypothetical protein